ncbi:MAG: hypothetical protein E7580_00225 [Ruminococcaceae bacterium]|nr:hypothetical protein [Oscillospiraceae bacterium]
MKRADEVYRKSLALIGEMPGEENETLKKRAVPIINVLLSQLSELELSLRGGDLRAGGIVPQITSLDDLIPFCEPIIYTVIPLGLAGFLLIEEEVERGRFFLQLYHTEVEILRNRSRRGKRHKIKRSV